MNYCPMCQKVVTGDLLTVKLDANVVVFHGCLPCWDTKVLAQDPIRRALWNFCAKHLQRTPVRKSIDELLKESGGKVNSDIALRVIEFARATNNPKATVEDVLVAERRAKMRASVIVGGADEDDSANDDPAPEGQ